MTADETDRYVTGPGVNEWHPASVFDTQHVRGQSPTRRVIPCASRQVAEEIAAELNAGIITIS